MLTPDELTALRHIIARAEHSTSQPPPDDLPDLQPGDIVQIRPSADRAWGSMLAVITATSPYELRGYLLRPHRGACRDAWLRLHHCDVQKAGQMLWPLDSEFAQRCTDDSPTCRRRHP